jgi:hypothetical protein
VRDVEHYLAHDRQVVLEQQVVVAMDAAADGVLDGQDAVVALPVATAVNTSSNDSQGSRSA